MAITSITDTIAALPKPTSLQFSYPRTWANEEGVDFSQDNAAAAEGATKSAFANMGLAVGGSFAKVAMHRKGVAINNREKVLFQNLPYRAVNFDWTLVAKNEDEFSNYLSFIDEMKKSSAPNQAQGGTFWEYPSTYELEISAGTETVFRSPELACTNVSLNWTPHGYWVENASGEPVSIGFSLEFKELQLALKDEIGSKFI